MPVSLGIKKTYHSNVTRRRKKSNTDEDDDVDKKKYTNKYFIQFFLEVKFTYSICIVCVAPFLVSKISNTCTITHSRESTNVLIFYRWRMYFVFVCFWSLQSSRAPSTNAQFLKWRHRFLCFHFSPYGKTFVFTFSYIFFVLLIFNIHSKLFFPTVHNLVSISSLDNSLCVYVCLFYTKKNIVDS